MTAVESLVVLEQQSFICSMTAEVFPLDRRQAKGRADGKNHSFSTLSSLGGAIVAYGQWSIGHEFVRS